MLLALAFVVAAFVILFDLIQPTYAELRVLKGKQLSSETFLENEQAIVNQVKKLVTQYENQGETETSLSLAMPSGPNVASALAQVYGIASNNNIVVSSIGISAPNAVLGGRGGAAAQVLKPMGTFMFQVTAGGSYENLKNFLAQLETNIRIFDVTSFSMQPAVVASGKGGAASDFFNYNFSVMAHYQLQ